MIEYHITMDAEAALLWRMQPWWSRLIWAFRFAFGKIKVK